MVPHLTYTKECLVYPGEYTMSAETEVLIKKLKKTDNSPGTQPPVNMEELDDCFKIRMIIPGVQREDLLIYINSNILSVIALHKHHDELREKLKIHEFDFDCIERRIPLPYTADTEFISAEYRQGILTMYIPKNQPALQPGSSRQIVIY